MAYSSTNAPRKILDTGIASAGSMWVYRSTHSSTMVIATGFFASAGVGSRSTANNGAGNVGMRVGDLVLCQETTDGTVPGRVTHHSVIGATADQASTLAATGYRAGYNVTISASSS
jgi:hypothetical protein